MIDQLAELKSLLSDIKSMMVRGKLAKLSNGDESSLEHLIEDEDAIDEPEHNGKKVTVVEAKIGKNRPEKIIEEEGDDNIDMSSDHPDEAQDRKLFKEMEMEPHDEYDPGEDIKKHLMKDPYKKNDIVNMGSRRVKLMKGR